MNPSEDIRRLSSQAEPRANETIRLLIDPDQIGEILLSARFADGFHVSPPSNR